MISAENPSEDHSVRNLLGVPGSHGWTRATKDSTRCGCEPRRDASDRNGGRLSVNEQTASALGPSLATGLPAQESRDNGRSDSGRQLSQVRDLHPAVVNVRGSPTTKYPDQALRHVMKIAGSLGEVCFRGYFVSSFICDLLFAICQLLFVIRFDRYESTTPGYSSRNCHYGSGFG